MKTVILSLLVIVSLTTVGQTPSKKDCYKKFQTVDTTYVNATWIDSNSVMHFNTGFVLIDAMGITCLPKVYDTVYSTKLFIVTPIDRRLKEIDTRFVVNLQEVKK